MPNMLPAVPELIELTPAKLELIKKTIFRDATDDELALFKYICEKRQLDPFAKQIYARKQRQKVWNPKTKQEEYQEQVLFITGIDGFRVIAERSKFYAGQVGPFWTDDGTTWVEVWLKDTPPLAAKVGINRKNFKDTLWAIARWKSYCPLNEKGQPQALWAKMPDGQLAKCAEALALRRAFPEDLSGMYVKEEMQQAGQEEDIEDAQIVETHHSAKALVDPVDSHGSATSAGIITPANVVSEDEAINGRPLTVDEAEGKSGVREPTGEGEALDAPADDDRTLTEAEAKTLADLVKATHPKALSAIRNKWRGDFQTMRQVRLSEVPEFCKALGIEEPL